MARPRPEPAQVVTDRRNRALAALVGSVPYIRFLNVAFDRRGDELTAILHYDDKLIGNPKLPALHGGATAAFLEITAIMTLGWQILWDEIENGSFDAENPAHLHSAWLPRTIDFTVDYLRPGLPRDAYARAFVTRSGRRYASVRTEAWQDHHDRPIAQAAGHFLMPDRRDG